MAGNNKTTSPQKQNAARRSSYTRLCMGSSGLVLTMLVFAAMPAHAQPVLPPGGMQVMNDPAPPAPPAFPTYNEDDDIINPVTGVTEKVLAVDGAVVTTKSGNAILIATAVGQTYSAPDANGVTRTYVVDAVTTNAQGRVVAVTLVVQGVADTPADPAPRYNANSVTALSTQGAGADGGNGSGFDPESYTPAANDLNVVHNVSHGGRGSNGSDGGGVRVCIPIIGCATVGKNPSRGGKGGDGPVITKTILASHGAITTVSDNMAGITIGSVGGNGGKGGDGWGVNITGAMGGGSGKGGNVTVTNHTSVTTAGADAHGMFIQSRSGIGGNGGTGYIFSGGGSGGAAGQGGDVRAENYGTIITSGAGAIGLFAQSLAGQAGSGGSSYGVVGDKPGQGSIGGNGGKVTVIHGGSIVTQGADAHGIMAQSIGGDGGRSGAAGGLMAMGGAGGAGGNAGEVNVTITSAGSIRTLNEGAHGVIAQSIGGGGGASKRAVGITGTGGSGGSGGDASSVTINNAGSIITEGVASRGLMAQSIGGGGGSGGDAGGLVGIGGRGAAAGNAGIVVVNNTGTITTVGNKADGIFAQSVGGGGGDGGSSSGVAVNIGGDGESGGNADTVTITHGGEIRTKGDDAAGIFAQALGGGGGRGGSAVSVSAFAGMALGGAGGKGGDGADTKVTFNTQGNGSSPLIITEGDRAYGAFVQSLGGGGGAGGYAAAGAVGIGGSIAIALGGSGGKGGSGKAAELHGNVNVQTKGSNATGLFVQSQGGGGGAGGMSIALSLSGSPAASGALSISLGGSGGDGGAGGKVTVNSGGSIWTKGNDSAGLFAQSLGGGGGNGGFSVSFSGAAGPVAAAAVAVGIGGSGGKGGAGDIVNATYNGNIITEGARSTGAMIHSLGGGGGAGGFNISGGVALSGGASGAATVGLGGSGGLGGAGGNVDGKITGSVDTKGDQSAGVIIQSTGGGGGSGGFNISGSIAGSGKAAGSVAVGLGGSGGGGGNAGEVTAYVTSIMTQGYQSTGFLAQSVGGGGGQGAFNISGGISLADSAAGSVTVGLGGSGGMGGAGNKVKATVVGDITTKGNQSAGIIAQSVGGGGGDGGMNISAGLTVSHGGSGGAAVGLGGSGEQGGAANTVMLDVTGLTQTAGTQSTAILAQSVGGGGGAGGMAVAGNLALSGSGAGTLSVGIGGSGGTGGAGDAVTVTVTGKDVINTDGQTIKVAALTKGDDSFGIIGQSLGGGGGAGGMSVAGGMTVAGTGGGNIAVGLGGAGGAGGKSGKVDMTVTGAVQTGGARAGGILAQSLGGNGGAGGMNIAGGIAMSNNASGNLLFGMGGFGGGGGDAELAKLLLRGGVHTAGASANAITVQSIGGGGGAGGMNVTGGLSLTLSSGGSASLGVGIGGFGGKGGKGGLAQADLSGNVSTIGAESIGALIQSVGGAGGAGGMNITGTVALNASDAVAASVGLGLGGFGEAGGAAGEVKAIVDGNYLTKGAEAHGVLAQSVGGGGGAGGMNITGSISASSGTSGTVGVGIGGFGAEGGAANNVTLTRTGHTQTEGGNANGVVAQSVGGGGGAGGMNVTGGLSLSAGGNAASLGLGLGGFGGKGGASGDVTATITGNVVATGLTEHIETKNADGKYTQHERRGGSTAVIVQSVGGGGGSGGMNITGQVSLTKPSGGSSRTAALGIGGFGGTGGDAGLASLTLGGVNATRAIVQARGDSESGILIQSVGGGGGAGGINIAGGLALDGNAVLGLGGFGGGGGKGAVVNATINADVTAGGTRARGILAQSVGGGGGTGGMNISGAITPHKGATEPVLALGIGGSGGAGNTSDTVTLSHTGRIIVDGVEAVGMLVQSIAGGGGDGGLNVAGAINMGGKTGGGYTASVAVGGSGGTGDDAGAVTVNSLGDVIVNAQESKNADGQTILIAADLTGDAAGVLVQSVGGGGGNGGINVGAALAPKGNPAVLGVGGSGGAAGNAARVDVVRGYETVNGVEQATGGNIIVFGDNSDGFVAQSVGGGGGRAGINVNFAGSNDADMAAVMAVGGGGGQSGDASDVNVRHVGNIAVNGEKSRGLIVQSLGGGGGNANYNLSFGYLPKSTAVTLAVGGKLGDGGHAKTVTLDHKGDISTTGYASFGILAQSIGGGGGNAVTSMAKALRADNTLNVSIGREGGTGGTSDTVTLKSDGRITTTGDEASAILAQSIGGGGGTSSSTSVSGSAQVSEDEKYSAGISVGLAGGAGARSGDVDVATKGVIVTTGRESRGIFAQSIGGGGGVGGSASNSVMKNTASATISVGGNGGTGAQAGKVKVDNEAHIETNGVKAQGILAQSIGGGGGAGGMAYSNVAAAGGGANADRTMSATLNVGGSGGTADDADIVDVANRGIILTNGENGHGIMAQSIGGGGGAGGMIRSTTVQNTKANQALDMNIGGAGGTGGAGKAVTVTNEGLIYTTGRESLGISASSIGGGGGDGGAVFHNVMGKSGGAQEHRLSINVGGNGGSGGIGGDVTVTNKRPVVGGVDNAGTIVTKGDYSYGVLAQSIGGGGGNGAAVLSVTNLKTGDDSVVAGLNIGGRGGTGNSAGKIVVDNHGTIDTAGSFAHGVLAQSIGGGGGNGGIAIAANMQLSKGSSAPLLSVGGGGGDGGDAGTVTVTNSGHIYTRGQQAHGIIAQSIGGGGGNANMSFAATKDLGSLVISNSTAALVGLIGGGKGGTGAEVVVNHSGDITTLGARSQAIVAQSVNGGGGNMTLDFSGLKAVQTDVPYLNKAGVQKVDPVMLARMGAERAEDMRGGKVTVNSTGTLGAGGDYTTAIFGQSVGGGGGTVHLHMLLSDGAATGETAAGDDVAVAVDMMLGGTGGTNNAGNDITSTHKGDVAVTGRNSYGIMQQTIGGGGGRATIDIDAPQNTKGVSDSDLTFGAIGGAGEAGGNIDYNYTGAIVITGEQSTGALFQSIGGGGGVMDVNMRMADTSSYAGRTIMGADGGSGQNAGDINLTLAGGVTTTAAGANGIVVQAIGGGGGMMTQASLPAGSVALGGRNSADGDGGNIVLTNTGAINTVGARAHGVFLQSIGGGGGAVFGAMDSATTMNNSADNTGHGGAINFTQNGTIVTRGAGSHGIVAQSIGGGGGWVDGKFAGTAGGTGYGGNVTVTVNDAVYALGDGSAALFLQSAGQDAANNPMPMSTMSAFSFAPMSIILNGPGDLNGHVNADMRGGGGGGAGVLFTGGNNNTLLIDAGKTLSAISGNAIIADTGNETITNNGHVVGNINIGAGNNTFNNEVGGTFHALNKIILMDGAGSTGVFVNNGQFNMGLVAPDRPVNLAAGEQYANRDSDGDPLLNHYYGMRAVTTVDVAGNFVQNNGGQINFDVAMGPYASDRLNVSGDLTLAGQMNLNVTWLENLDPVTLFTAGGAVNTAGLTVAHKNLAVQYGLVTDANGVHLQAATNFGGQSSLNGNGGVLGRHMDSALKMGGSSGIGHLTGLLANMQPGDEAAYNRVFAELNPEPLVAPQMLRLGTAARFADRMFSCTGALDERCGYAAFEHSMSRRDASADYLRTKADVTQLGGGFAVPVSDQWAVILSLGYESLGNLNVDGNRAHIEGQGVNAGGGIQWAGDNGLMAGLTVTGGWSWLESTRAVDVFMPQVATATPQTQYAQVTSRFGYGWDTGAFFGNAGIGAAVTSLRQSAFTEDGIGGMGMSAQAHVQTLASVSPRVVVGHRFALGTGLQGAASVTASSTHYTDDSVTMPYRFRGANARADSARIETGFDRDSYHLGGTMEFWSGQHYGVQVQYGHTFGDDMKDSAVSARLRMNF